MNRRIVAGIIYQLSPTRHLVAFVLTSMALLAVAVPASAQGIFNANFDSQPLGPLGIQPRPIRRR